MDANSRNCSSSHHHDRTHRTQETPTPATGQASLHAGGGHKDPPARDTQGPKTDPLPRIEPESGSYPSEESSGATTSVGSAGRVCRDCGGDLYAVGNDPNRCTCDNLNSDPHSSVAMHP
jgi:hypothetical protein